MNFKHLTLISALIMGLVFPSILTQVIEPKMVTFLTSGENEDFPKIEKIIRKEFDYSNRLYTWESVP